MPGRIEPRTWPHNPTLNAPAKYRRACRYDSFIPDKLAQLPLQLEATVAGVVSEAEAAIRSLNSEGYPVLRPLARLLLQTESIASSKIEGLQTSLRELASAEAKLKSGVTVGPSAREVLANIEAMELALQEASTDRAFIVADIKAIHHRLMETSPNGASIAGEIRTDQTWIGGNDYNPCGADFVPPPPEEVPGLLDDLSTAINDEVLPPLVQAALVHAQFETIHPFADGNGRTGRALIHVILRRRDLAASNVPPISVILGAKRDRYIAGLTAFRGDKVADWVEQFAGAARNAAKIAAAYLEQVHKLIATWRAALQSRRPVPRSDAVAWTLIERLPAHPFITASVAIAATDRSPPQVYEALDQLEQAGVLAPASRSQRNRSWEPTGLIELLEGLEAGEMPESDP
jgi:Fic family protein